MSEYSISVIIPTYNNAEYLPQAIDSVLSQTYKVSEIIVINDGSTDDTLKVLEKYKKSITYLETNRSGAAKARNIGMKNANGNLIAFLDADDIWMPDKVMVQVKVFDEYPEVGMVYSKLVNFNDCNNDSFVAPEEIYSGDIFEKLLIKRIIGLPTVMLRKEVVDRVGYFNEDLITAEDTNYFLRVTNSYKAYAINRPLVRRRIHDSNISNIFSKQVGTLTCLDDIVNRFPEFHPDRYPIMKKAYQIKGMKLLLESFNSGEYSTCNYFSKEIFKRNILLKQSLFFYFITLLPDVVIDVIRNFRRTMNAYGVK